MLNIFGKFKAGDLVKWNDPGINDYEPEDREYVANRAFRIQRIDTENLTAYIVEVNGGSEAEVYLNELKPMKEAPIRAFTKIFRNDVKRAEQILVKNGVGADEVQAVLQELGYVLLNRELYANEKAIVLENDRQFGQWW